MKTTLRISLRAMALAWLGVSALAPRGAAQIPGTPKYAIPPPPTGAQAGYQLGYSVATDGGYIVAGTPYDDKSAQESGAVKVFDATTGALLLVLPDPSPATFEDFGKSVAVSGTLVAVGGNGKNTGVNSSGIVYVYDLAGATPTQPVWTLNNPNPSMFGSFGSALAISGTRLVVGASQDNTGASAAGRAYMYDLAGGTPTVPILALNNPAPAASDHFGSAVAIDGARVVVGAQDDDAGATDAGSAYIYDLSSATPAVPVVTLPNPHPAASGAFGAAVAISGLRAVVASYGENSSVAGSAYVYDLSSATPAVPALTLHSPTPSPNDFFGHSLALSGATVVVGAYGDDTGAANAGGAYVYDLTGATPTVPAVTLSKPTLATFDFFGWAVAITGTRVVASAIEDDLGAQDAGSVYAYDLSSATPALPVLTLNSPGPSPFDQFGTAVALSATRMVVGAPGIASGGITGAYPGSVYVYDLASATPTVPVLILNNPVQKGMYGQFGISVAIDGTLVVVGADQEDTGAIDAGSAYVYDLTSGTPAVPILTLHKPNPSVNDHFGFKVGISGPLVAIGAPGDDTGATDAGSVYVYNLAIAAPALPVLTLNNPHPGPSSPTDPPDAFGSALVIEGMRVAVGAPGDDSAALDAGRAYVYDLGSATPTVPVVTLNSPNSHSHAGFGFSLALAGPQLVVGAPFDSSASTNGIGHAFLYDLSSGTPAVPVATLNNPTPALQDYFGYSVGISGSRIVVGAPKVDAGATDAGVAYLYDLAGTSPTAHTATLYNPSPVAGDQFGYAVAIAGTTVAVGVPFSDSEVLDKGYAYVFAPTATANDTNADGLLDSWEFAQFGDTGTHDLLGDDEHDGVGNLLEEAFGTDPLIPDRAAIPAVVNEGGYLTITISKHPGVTYQVQSAATTDPAAFSAATTTVLLDNATTLKARDNVPVGTTPGRFMRVQVTAAP